MDLLGGPVVAGAIHRACASITFLYFSVAIALSVHYLFYSKEVEGSWKERLLGPDSLFPNWQDWEQLKGMFRWFFFKGPKPLFDRWTYWEKFDFFAVFWGMFAIGSSGLVLWFPELFGTVLPGWIFNVATIVHSEEALLATGFIFTVHFFNTHLRPEKFPMDFVIFNGEISKEEMIEERQLQWERLERSGKTRLFEKERPSSMSLDISLRIVGFAAVITGFALAALIIYAYMS
jgi:hypothetical protein